MRALTNGGGLLSWTQSNPTSATLFLAVAVGCCGALALTALASAVSPLTALLGMLGLVVAAAMMVSPNVALWVVCFSLPFERIGRLTNDADQVAVSVSRIVGIIALASLLLHAALKKEKLKIGVPLLLYAGYTAIALLSNVWAYAPEDTLRDSFRVLGNLLFFFLIINLIRDYRQAKRAAIVWLLATIAAGVYSLGDYYFATSNPVAETEMGLTSQRLTTVVSDGAEARNLGMNVKRMFGTTAHPTLFGLNMTMAIPFFLWALQSQRGWWRPLWLGGLLVAAYGIVLSNTRAVFLTLIFVVGFCYLRRVFRPSLQAVTILVLLAVAVGPFIPEDVYRRTLDPALYTTGGSDSLRARFKYWEKSWEIIQETWLLGIGVGNQTLVVQRVTDENSGFLSSLGLRAAAHNEYITVMLEVGLFGYLLHWGFVAVVTRAGYRAAARLGRQPDGNERRLLASACTVAMTAILFFACQSEAFHYPLKAWWLAAAISCALLAEAETPGTEAEPA